MRFPLRLRAPSPAVTPVSRVVGMVLLSACTLTACTAGSGAPTPAVGSTATGAAASSSATALVDRYHQSGGDLDVYAMEKEPGTSSAAPRFIIRTRNPDGDDAAFQKQKESIVQFLTRVEALSPGQGYLMDVYGPDGSLLHRLDTRP